MINDEALIHFRTDLRNQQGRRQDGAEAPPKFPGSLGYNYIIY